VTQTGASAECPPPGIRVVSTARALCAESPLWDPRHAALCWTDIDGRHLFRAPQPGGEVFARPMPGRVGCIALHHAGGYVAAIEDRLMRLGPDFSPEETLGTAGFDPAVQRFNDGKADPWGAYFWVGSIFLPRTRTAAGLWRLGPDGALAKVLEGFTTVNGIAWSPDGRTMYVSDSWHRTIWAADYDPAQGEISRRRVHYRLAPVQGRPDGAAVDCDGFYWCAGFGGGQLLRIAPDGRLDRTVRMPMRCPTMPAFGGEGADILFVTSYGDLAALPELANDPMAGEVIALNLNVRGRPEAALTLGAGDAARGR